MKGEGRKGEGSAAGQRRQGQRQPDGEHQWETFHHAKGLDGEGKQMFTIAND